MLIRFHRRRIFGLDGEDPTQVIVRLGPMKFNVCYWRWPEAHRGLKFYWED